MTMTKSKKKYKKTFHLLLSLLLALSFGIKAYASLTLDETGITSDGVLTLTSSSETQTLPTMRGTAGQFLQTDGAGVTSWATIGGTEGALEVTANKSLNILTDGTSDLKYPSVKAVKDYADSLVVGLLDYRGGYNASSNSYPVIGGSGAGGTILKGDTYIISTAGTLNGTDIQVGDSITANIDNPGQTATNWNTLNTNISYVPEDQANKVTSITGASTDTQYPSAKLLFDQLALKQSPIALTSTGTSGAATFIGNVLNIPQYAGATNVAGTGLTLTAGSFSVNTSQNISTLSNLTTNGILKTSGGNGALSIATGADLPAMTATTRGAVPTPPNNTTTFLRGDGIWATPPTGGGGLPSGCVDSGNGGISCTGSITASSFVGSGTGPSELPLQAAPAGNAPNAKLYFWPDTTDKVMKVKDENGIVSSTVVSNTCPVGQFVSAVTSAGIVTCTSPSAFTGTAISLATGVCTTCTVASGWPNTVKTVTIPAGVLGAGDQLRVYATYTKSGGTTNLVRVGIQMGGADIVGTTVMTSGADVFIPVFGYATILTSTTEETWSQTYRGASTNIIGTGPTSISVNTANPINITFLAGFSGGTGETISLRSYAVSVIKAQ